jgi:hypothetical protein
MDRYSIIRRETHRWASPFSPFSLFANRITFHFFDNKRKNDKLPFARWANGKLIKENRPVFRFLYDVFLCKIAAYICIYINISLFIYIINIYIYIFICIHIYKENGTYENCNFCLFSANGNRKRNFVFLGRQMINDRWLLFKQTCPSMTVLLAIIIRVSVFEGKRGVIILFMDEATYILFLNGEN